MSRTTKTFGSLTPDKVSRIKKAKKLNPEMTNSQLAARFMCSSQTISKALRRVDLTIEIPLPDRRKLVR